MSGLAYEPKKKFEKVLEFDLTFIHPGKWIMQSKVISDAGYWHTRQAHAMSMANNLGSGHETLIIRLHNRWLPDFSTASSISETQASHEAA